MTQYQQFTYLSTQDPDESIFHKLSCLASAWRRFIGSCQHERRLGPNVSQKGGHCWSYRIREELSLTPLAVQVRLNRRRHGLAIQVAAEKLIDRLGLTQRIGHYVTVMHF